MVRHPIAPYTWSGNVEEFFRYVHREDRQRVSQAATDARVNHKQCEAEFRVVRQDGAVRWVTARGHAQHAPGLPTFREVEAQFGIRKFISAVRTELRKSASPSSCGVDLARLI